MLEPEFQGCRARDVAIAELKQEIACLSERLRDVEARLGRNASNSSMPPSANPLDAPPPVVKKPTGRKPGGHRHITPTQIYDKRRRSAAEGASHEMPV